MKSLCLSYFIFNEPELYLFISIIFYFSHNKMLVAHFKNSISMVKNILRTYRLCLLNLAKPQSMLLKFDFVMLCSNLFL